MAGLLNKAKGLQASPWCVSCEHTPSVRGDRPHRLQQLHWCDTCTCPLASLLCCQSFHFYSSSPPKSVKDLEPIKAREMGFTCEEITSKDSPFRDAWKAKQWSSTIKTVFPHPFLLHPPFSLRAIDFKMRTPVATSLFLLAHRNLFSIVFHCSLLWFDWDAWRLCWFHFQEDGEITLPDILLYIFMTQTFRCL